MKNNSTEILNDSEQEKNSKDGSFEFHFERFVLG